LAARIEVAYIESAVGLAVTGSDPANQIYGGGAGDTCWVNWGSDTVKSEINHTLTANVENLALGWLAKTGTGNALNNVITGCVGSQVLRGMAGAGADVFVFATGDNRALAGYHDTITDFQRGKDKIDLTAMDSNSTDEGHTPMIWLGTGAFTNHQGEMRYEAVSGGLQLQIDTTSDGAADMAMDLLGPTNLGLGDFLL